ncbi:MAG TPA: asparagine synthase-related protein [Candidatus Bathyarchaeia archaeon]|nr:asparagine synthase-related protein [Candidatus Bathyarchaeia archaeon]
MFADVDEVCSKLRILLEKAVENNPADGILFSGGLDTSVLAVIASKFIPLKLITVAFQNSSAPDVEYAVLMASKLGLEHIIHVFDEDELYDAIAIVVKTMKSFDPMEIRNSVTIYVGLKAAKEIGVSTIMTGDGSDELLAGYSFLFGLEREKLDLELKKMWNVMAFSSVPLAKTLGMEAKLPYLDQNFKDFAMKLDSQYKIRTENGRTHGKWILRKTFEEHLPPEVTWRVKTPIEYGSGTNILTDLFNRKILDPEFDEKRRRYFAQDGVAIRDKEQLFYYEVYRSLIGVPYSASIKGKACPQCNSSIAENATYCRTCGAYPL